MNLAAGGLIAAAAAAAPVPTVAAAGAVIAAAEPNDDQQNDDPAAVVAAEQGVEACHKSTRSFLKAFERRGSPPSKVEYAIGRHVVTQPAVVQRKVAKSSVEFPLFGKKQERPCQNTN